MTDTKPNVIDLISKDIDLDENNTIALLSFYLMISDDSDLGKLLNSLIGVQPENAPLKAGISPTPGQNLSAFIRLAKNIRIIFRGFLNLSKDSNKIDLPKVTRGIPIESHDLILKQIPIIIGNLQTLISSLKLYLKLQRKIVDLDKSKSTLAIKSLEANKPTEFTLSLEGGKVNLDIFKNVKILRLYCQTFDMNFTKTLELISNSDQTLESDKSSIIIDDLIQMFSKEEQSSLFNDETTS